MCSTPYFVLARARDARERRLEPFARRLTRESAGRRELCAASDGPKVERGARRARAPKPSNEIDSTQSFTVGLGCDHSLPSVHALSTRGSVRLDSDPLALAQVLSTSGSGASSRARLPATSRRDARGYELLAGMGPWRREMEVFSASSPASSADGGRGSWVTSDAHGAGALLLVNGVEA